MCAITINNIFISSGLGMENLGVQGIGRLNRVSGGSGAHRMRDNFRKFTKKIRNINRKNP